MTGLRREQGLFVLTTGSDSDRFGAYRRYYRTVLLPLALWDLGRYLLVQRHRDRR